MKSPRLTRIIFAACVALSVLDVGSATGQHRVEQRATGATYAPSYGVMSSHDPIGTLPPSHDYVEEATIQQEIVLQPAYPVGTDRVQDRCAQAIQGCNQRR
jgi:hypothetical protein